MSSKVPGRVACLAALPFLLLSGVVVAANLKVAPVRVNFEPSQRSDVVTLTNGGDEEVSVQADAVSWTQDESGGDVYEDTTDLLVVPRIFTIPPGETQVVRIGRMVAADDVRQGAYRVFFTELAPPAESGESPGLRFRLRLGIPVFTRPVTPAEPGLTLLSSARTDVGLEFVLTNPGQTHVQVLNLKSGRSIGRGAHDIEHGIGAYHLPGTTRHFVVPLPRDLRLTAFALETDVAGTTEHVAPPAD